MPDRSPARVEGSFRSREPDDFVEDCLSLFLSPCRVIVEVHEELNVADYAHSPNHARAGEYALVVWIEDNNVGSARHGSQVKFLYQLLTAALQIEGYVRKSDKWSDK